MPPFPLVTPSSRMLAMVVFLAPIMSACISTKKAEPTVTSIPRITERIQHTVDSTPTSTTTPQPTEDSKPPDSPAPRPTETSKPTEASQPNSTSTPEHRVTEFPIEDPWASVDPTGQTITFWHNHTKARGESLVQIG